MQFVSQASDNVGLLLHSRSQKTCALDRNPVVCFSIVGINLKNNPTISMGTVKKKNIIYRVLQELDNCLNLISTELNRHVILNW